MAYKLCVKGVFDNTEFKASVGGVLKKNERWVRGVGGMIGLADPETAELWAIFYGLKMAWERQYTSVVLFSESRRAIGRINNPDPDDAMAGLVDMITMLLSENWTHVELQHTHADANCGASVMATHFLATDGGVTEMAEPPAAIRHVV